MVTPRRSVLLTLGTAIFVAAEFSLVALDRSLVERAIEDGDKRAVGVLSAVRTLSTQLSGAQVGITITTLIVGYLAQPRWPRCWKVRWKAWGWRAMRPKVSRSPWPWPSPPRSPWWSAS